MKEHINQFIAEVTKAARNPRFKHHSWYVDYHLKIVEKIAISLCRKYPAANRSVVLLLVWLHDYGKMVDYEHQHEATITFGREKLAKIGFKPAMIDQALEYVKIIDNHGRGDLAQAPIEVKIVSSADGAAHLIGPFYAVYWYENPQKSICEIMAGNRKKADMEWKEKIVLPEVKKEFKKRYEFILEQNGYGRIISFKN
ncbi:TPA: hypothetical protein DF272_02085 [Candidatus Falkowbacteria bacterium]|nr:hypothetical protein [Candidatus Falkowbacteria bacterium]